MACDGCVERGEFLTQALEAYKRGDHAECKRLLKEALGSLVKDINTLTRLAIRGPDGKMEHLEFKVDKSTRPPT